MDSRGDADAGWQEACTAVGVYIKGSPYEEEFRKRKKESVQDGELVAPGKGW
jgi:hypothetical protein